MRKSILITGANRGIGFVLTEQYASLGWRVYACCRNLNEAEKLIQLKEKFNNIIPHKLEVNNDNDIKQLCEALHNSPIDILVNNAGVFGRRATLGEIIRQDFQDVLSVNVTSVFILTQALLPNLKLGKNKLIINVSSGWGSIANNSDGAHYIYRASKAALNSITKSLAIDLKKDKLSVVAISPGWVNTDMGRYASGNKTAPQSAAECATTLAGLFNQLNLTNSGDFMGRDAEQIPW